MHLLRFPPEQVHEGRFLQGKRQGRGLVEILGTVPGPVQSLLGLIRIALNPKDEGRRPFPTGARIVSGDQEGLLGMLLWIVKREPLVHVL